MTVLVPSAPLRLLAALKARAWLRTLRRRLSSPAGLAFALLGLVLFGSWLVAIGMGLVPARHEPGPGAAAEPLARAVLGLFALLVGASSLAHRGLYVPEEEIERLLSGPVSRADLVRYRLWIALARSTWFTLLAATALGMRMPVTAFGVAGAWLALSTLSVLGTTLSILFGNAESRLGRWAARVPVGALRVVAAVLLWLLALAVVRSVEAPEDLSGSWDERARLGFLGRGSLLVRVMEHPLARACTLPALPWARAMAAEGHAAFWPWAALALVLFLAVFELTARVPVDFRELSLATSHHVARRLARWRSGRGAVAGTSISAAALGWRIPWAFGRSPFGAIAWLKCCAIVRRSRGTLYFALFATAVATLLAWKAFADPLAGALFVCLLGTIYLASGLRFDFRSDLDWMEVVRAWPVRPWRVFLATLLPEIVLVSGLITGAIVGSAWARGELSAEVGWVMLATPALCTMWLALDNALFLLAPVRYVPGQGSALHHAGRTAVLVIARLALLSILILTAALARELTLALGERLAWTPSLRAAAALVVIAVTVLGGCVACVAFGAWSLGRFDVARQRGLTL